MPPAEQAAAAGSKSWIRTPFGDGYRAIAHAYRYRTQDLLPADLRALAGLPPEGRSSVYQQWHDRLMAAYQSSKSQGGVTAGTGSWALMALDIACRRKSIEVAALEAVASFLHVVAVFCLGLVLRELEQGGAESPEWMQSWIGVEASEHAGLRAGALALVVFLARYVQQEARHRRARKAAEVGVVLRSWLFRAAAGSTTPGLPALPDLLVALPSMTADWAKSCRFRLAGPALGVCFGAAAVIHASGPFALAAIVSLTAAMLGGEVFLRCRLAPRWQALAQSARRRREAVSAAFLGEDGSSAAAVVKYFAWERACFQRLGQLRAEERQALRREARYLALASALRSELLRLLPLAGGLVACALLSGQLSLWQSFQTLAASRLVAEALRSLFAVMLVARPRDKAGKLENILEGLQPASPPPTQGDRATYRAAKFAVAIEGMRFFWPGEGTSAEGTANKAAPTGQPGKLQNPGPSALEIIKKKASKKATSPASNGLELVDSVTDDASVAERARRATHGIQRFDLKVLSFQVKRGSAVALAGATSSGKSTLISALLGGCQRELWGDDAERNGVFLSGKLAYVPQKPIHLAGCTIRENVLCGLAMDALRYEQALIASTLSEDLAAFPNGDRSMLKDLPPGDASRACLQLARALYHEAQILLLDDPFTSLPPERAKRALANIVKKGNKEKTVILATQNLSLLSQMDTIVVLRNGTIFEQGDYKTLTSMPTEFSRLLLISKQKEAARETQRKQAVEGIPCPFLCYEVGADPMAKIFPLDEEWGTLPAFGPGHFAQSLQSKKFWASREPPPLLSLGKGVPSVSTPAKLADSQLSSFKDDTSAPDDHSSQLKQTSRGADRRQGVYSEGPGLLESLQELLQTDGETENETNDEGDAIFGRSADRERAQDSASHKEDVNNLFSNVKDLFSKGSARHHHGLSSGQDSSRQHWPESSRATGQAGAPAFPVAAAGSGALFAGDEGVVDLGDQESRFPVAAVGETSAQDPGFGQILNDLSKEAAGDLESQMHRGDVLSQVPERRALPSASAVPIVGCSEAGGGAFGQGAMGDSSRPPAPPAPGYYPPAFVAAASPDDIPEDQAIPLVSISSGAAAASNEWAPDADDEMLPPPFEPVAWPVAPPDPGHEINLLSPEAAQALPTSPHSDGGLRRRVAAPGGPEDDLVDFEATNAPKPAMRSEGAHGAVPPGEKLGRSTRDDDEDADDRKKRERGRGKEADPRVHRLDVLERALKEKNDKIAELERQMLMRGVDDETKELLRSGSSSSNLGSRSFHQAPIAREAARRGRGKGVLLLLGRGGLSSLLLVLVVLLMVGAQMSAPVLLGYLVASPELRAKAAVARSSSSSSSPAGNTERQNPAGEGENGKIATTTAWPGTALQPSAAFTTTARPTVGLAPLPPPPPPSLPQMGGTDESQVIWRGFLSTTKAQTGAPTTSTPKATSAAVVTIPVGAQASSSWNLNRSGHFCAEADLQQDSKPQGQFELDPSIGWHWVSPLFLDSCKVACEDLFAGWGCRFISWGGPATQRRWCYVHKHCNKIKKVSTYQIHELNTSSARLLQASVAVRGPATSTRRLPGQESSKQHRLLQSLDSSSSEVNALNRWFAWTTRNLVQACLGGVCVLLEFLGTLQARLAARVALQACHESSLRQLRSLLAAPVPARWAGGGLAMVLLSPGALPDEDQKSSQQPFMASTPSDGPGFFRDVTDADLFLPVPLLRCLAALVQSLAALGGAAAAMERQAVPAVGLALVIGLSLYFHRLRLPLLMQLRRFQTSSEAAARLQVQHLAECHEVIQVHGCMPTLCEEYEALCRDLAQAVITADAAERWVYSRIHCLVSLLLGLMCFSLLAEVQALSNDRALAMAGAALLQLALLPEPAAAAAKHGARMTHGLAALRRMRQVCRELPSEELESPALRMRLATERETKDVERGRAKLKARHGKVVLGDSLIERDTSEERHAQLYDLSMLEQEQCVSVDGFPLEHVAGDWPNFGAIEFEDVTLRYSIGLTPALQDCSLRVPGCRAMLVVGPEGSGKTSLVKGLLRLCNLEAGRVVLDCVDVRSVGLSTLRGRISVVPQETIVFKGTWRINLDPMGEFDEEQLLLVLRLTRLENLLLREAPRGLDELIGEPEALGAAAPLLGLCRGLLRLLQGRSKLLVLDRCTCRLSTTSDADLTAMVLRYCRRRGVALLQVSRRLHQAALYDEVAAMQGGRILEQGPPKKLWVKDSAFRRMAREQGLDSSKLTKPDLLAARLASVWGWEVSPQEAPDWGDEFSVAMKKVRSDKDKKGAKA
eukprot:TRINITY_DN26918_c0_g1_i1.p1 TRINITY_DN26918_c0_g1~~TRINITY_DN26918_c0_g1_i1.p1  ORF type:complete len:2320 (-),score=461.07 TRINITY_DN26918_c0_g1_i1:23-6874(-)